MTLQFVNSFYFNLIVSPFPFHTNKNIIFGIKHGIEHQAHVKWSGFDKEHIEIVKKKLFPHHKIPSPQL